MLFWKKLMQYHSDQPRNSKLISKFSVFLHCLPTSWNNTISTEKCLADNWKFIKTKKQQKLVPYEVPLDRFETFFTSIKHVSLTVISSIEYIYVYIEYIYVYIKYMNNKSNTQNCQAENNMKMIFATEKLKSLVTMLSKLHDHGKATSIRTRTFPLSKTFRIN